MSSAQTEALVQALAPHLGDGGEEEARDAAESLPQELHLFNNAIGAAGATAIAPHLPQALHTLELGGIAIGAAGARAIAPHLPQALQTLSLAGNGIGCSDAEVLAYARAFRAWTPLHRAADTRDARALHSLLDEGADPRLCVPAAASARTDMRSALSLSASAAYPLALPVDAALRAEVEHAATRVRWSRVTHWQCPRDVRVAARARALLLGGRGMPVMNDDVWRVVLSFLIDGEHARRPLRGEGAVLGACCVGGDAAAPCAACRAALYSDGDDGAEQCGAAPSSRSHRARKRVHRA